MISASDLQDIEEIRQLKARYVRCGDTKEWAGFRDLLAEDFEAHYDAMPRMSRDAPVSGGIKGRATFLELFPVMLANAVTVHQLFSSEVTITSPTTATAIFAMHDTVKLPMCVFRGWGHYHEEYVKIDGAWRLRKSHVTRLASEEQWL